MNDLALADQPWRAGQAAGGRGRESPARAPPITRLAAARPELPQPEEERPDRLPHMVSMDHVVDFRGRIKSGLESVSLNKILRNLNIPHFL